MKHLLVGAALLLLAACATPGEDSAAAPSARGAAIAEANCSSCHAIGHRGDSPLAEAPPFRRLSERFPVSDLQEALAEGISVGHPAMPHFAFAPEDIDALILYLESIQAEAVG